MSSKYTLFRNVILLSILFLGLAAPEIAAQDANTNQPVSMNIEFNSGEEGEDFGVAIQLVIFMTLLTLAPSIIMLMTCFTRIVIVLGFVGKAIGTQGTPSNQIIVGISLFLTFFIMAPTWDSIYEEAVSPYMEKEITSKEALSISSTHLRSFMLAQTREKDVEFMLGLSGSGPTTVSELPMSVVIPSFIVSELRTAFQMGFMIFIPFLIVDFIVASTLMSMGMMMMPPVVISLPFKLLLFVLVDGWSLVIESIVKSFNY